MTRPGAGLRLLRRLLPLAERDEVIADLEAEHERRRARDGRVRAGWWLWRQVAGSVIPLVRRSAWRGMKGFEPESSRMRTGGPMLETWLMDARYAVRRLLHRPTYTVLAVMTLALGVGGTAAIYGIARELLFEPLPVRAEADVYVWWMDRDWTEAEHLYLRASIVPGFESVAAYGQEDVRLNSDGAVQVLPAVRTSAELFDVLGVRPELGAGFERGDDLPGAEPKVILSHGLWQDLGGDASVVGRTIELNGVQRTVAGVMPAGFWFPEPSTRAWMSHGFSSSNQSGWYTMIGRVRAGTTQPELANALSQITAVLAAEYEYPEAWDKTADPHVTPVREYVIGSARPTLLATLTAMAVILLMACANVAALMLGQTEARSTEMSVRNALGAGRRRLTQQLLVEGLALGLAAGLAGAAIAAGAFRILLAALPLGALSERATLDWPVFWASLLLALVAALVIAMIPVLSVMRADLRGALTSGRTSGIAGRGGSLESGLVVAEVALAVIVAAGAAVLLRSVNNLRSLETGIGSEQVAIVDVVAPAELPNAERTRLIGELVESMRSVPGVAEAAATMKLPLRGSGNNWGLSIEGRPEVEGVTTSFRMVTRNYFDVLGARLVQGRVFDSSDRADSEPVIVINESLAREYFGGMDPIGQRISNFGEWARVIGVIADMQERGLTDEAHPARYVLYEQAPWAPADNALVLRAAVGLDPATLAAAARSAVPRAAPGVGVQDATTLGRVIDRALGPVRQLTSLLSMLAALALLLGGIGVYGVVGHFVQRRRRDWGIRMALGYRPRQVVAHVTARGSLLVLAGIVLGIGGALALMRVLEAFVYGVAATDPRSLAAAAIALLLVGVTGALVPGWRASRVDPARVLREQ